jgi:hypothetical protein
MSRKIWWLCQEAAEGIYGSTAPTEAYAARVAELLLGIAAHESHLVERRQRGFGWESNRGAWGLWQMEEVAVAEVCRYLALRPDVSVRVGRFVFGWDVPAEWWRSFDNGTLLRALSGWPRLGVALARVYLLRIPKPVPRGYLDQAEYWKRWWNTEAGKGTVKEYLRNWQVYAAPVLVAN